MISFSRGRVAYLVYILYTYKLFSCPCKGFPPHQKAIEKLKHTHFDLYYTFSTSFLKTRKYRTNTTKWVAMDEDKFQVMNKIRLYDDLIDYIEAFV